MLRARRRRTAVLVGLVAAATPELARAQSRLELEWDAPPECPRAAAVNQKLDALLGDAAAKTSRLRAEGRIVRVDGRYRLTLTVHEQDRTRDRTIESESCGDLAGAAAVTLGLLLRAQSEAATGAGTSPSGAAENPNGAAGNESDVRGAAPAAAPAAAKSPGAEEHDAESRSETPQAPSPPPRWNVLLRVPTAHLDVGRLPKTSFGLGGGVGFRYGDWRAGFSGRIFFGQTLWSNLASPDGGAEVHRAVLEAWICRGFRWADFELSPCVTAGLDHLGAKGAGMDVIPESATSNSALLGGAAVVHYHLAEWLAVVGSAGLGVETARPRLTITSLGDVQTLGPILFSVGVGPEWIF